MLLVLSPHSKLTLVAITVINLALYRKQKNKYFLFHPVLGSIKLKPKHNPPPRIPNSRDLFSSPKIRTTQKPLYAPATRLLFPLTSRTSLRGIGMYAGSGVGVSICVYWVLQSHVPCLLFGVGAVRVALWLSTQYSYREGPGPGQGLCTSSLFSLLNHQTEL